MDGVMGLCYVALLSCVRLLSLCPSVHPLLLHERLPVRARVGGRDGAHVLLPFPFPPPPPRHTAAWGAAAAGPRVG